MRFALGVERLDAALGGGLARARLHELYPAGEDDIACAAGFALMLALLAGGRQGPFVWIAEDRLEKRFGRIHAPGVAELGADPARWLFVDAPDEKALLRIAADVVRSPAAGVAVIAPAGPAPAFDLTATRRLTLFAERSGRHRDPVAVLRAADRIGGGDPMARGPRPLDPTRRRRARPCRLVRRVGAPARRRAGAGAAGGMGS